MAAKWLTAFLKKRYKVVIAVLASVVIITTTVITLPLLLDKGGKGREHGKGLNIAFLKGLSIDLNGITALAIEKRPTTNKTVQGVSYNGLTERSFSYADEVDEKYKLVGEKEDKSVEEITLRTKLGEIYQQDDLQAEFNKLCVSGDFIYFELIPDDTEEQQAEDGSYEYVDEGGVERSTRLTQRDNVSEANLEEFDKESNPSPLVGIFVYSIENEKIYDLSNDGYEVLGREVVKIGGNVCRAYINENDEYEVKGVFNSIQSQKVQDLKIDKWGNIIGKSIDDFGFEDTEARVFVQAMASGGYNNTPIAYVLDSEGTAIRLTDKGEVKILSENGTLRDPIATDNIYVKAGCRGWIFKGITNGEAIYYETAYYRSYYDQEAWGNFHKLVASIGKIQETFLSENIIVATVGKTNGIYKYNNFNDFNNSLHNANILVWVDLSNFQYEDGYKFDEDTGEYLYIQTIEGLHVIEQDFASAYPNAVQNFNHTIWDFETFTIKTINGETTYEFYWNEENQEVKIRVKEEIVASPKEVNKFQPIG
ncbi:MAG: hypothetical protein LBP62_06365 [Clostridiales bacterium]|nr:hypothetical protein [Clostridiales bacterium]